MATAQQEPKKRTATLYAESRDGIAFRTPALGLVPWGAENSTANNIVFATGEADSNRGVYFDAHEPDKSRRFKAFGSFDDPTFTNGTRSKLGTLLSADGLRWHSYQPADAMDARADTANQLTYDAHLARYIAFTRKDCYNETCGKHEWGVRREARSVSVGRALSSGWYAASEAGHGTKLHDEFYSLAPWRQHTWRPGLYLAIASFYNDTLPRTDGKVACELVKSGDFGATWQRVAPPHTPLIPPGAAGAYDSHTCYAAPPIADPSDPQRTLLYYAGGNGPHSGKRADAIGRATATTDALAGHAATAAAGGLVVTRPLRARDAGVPGGCLRVLVHGRRPQGGELVRVVAALAEDGGADDHHDDEERSAASSTGSMPPAIVWRAEARVPALNVTIEQGATAGVGPQWLTLRGTPPPPAPPDGLQRVRLRFELAARGLALFAFEACV